MSLSLLFRLLAAFNALWAIQLIFMPGMMFEQYQWTPSLELVALGQGTGVAMTSLAILAYQLPNWTTAEQLKNAAKSVGVIAILFLLLQLYQLLISGMAPGNAMDWGSTVITALFAIGFFMKSR
ncbi:MAG: hypothetical protein NZ867_05485 [SAR324 cluster bacterium]|jgi:hypothetical protein|nr:hypothetical protein [SAR324 cluster bacterium]|tara:strand:+ start:199 stop:570 length:372 start_codon:yes stop_codon:yes gene_type:complete